MNELRSETVCISWASSETCHSLAFYGRDPHYQCCGTRRRGVPVLIKDFNLYANSSLYCSLAWCSFVAFQMLIIIRFSWQIPKKNQNIENEGKKFLNWKLFGWSWVKVQITCDLKLKGGRCILRRNRLCSHDTSGQIIMPPINVSCFSLQHNRADDSLTN